jgi:prepilin-type processing-associated H-X9-DG protein
MMVFHDDYGAEPHEEMLRTTPIGGWNMLSESWLIRRRNVLYNDGHVKFLKLDSHPSPDGPLEGGF